MRFIASAIIVLAGATCWVASAISAPAGTFPIDSTKFRDVGTLLLVVGGLCFVVEYVRSWTDNGTEAASERAKQVLRLIGLMILGAIAGSLLTGDQPWAIVVGALVGLGAELIIGHRG